MDAAAPGTCRVLEWDSAFFGRRIASVEGPLDAAAMARALAFCQTNAIDCLYLLSDADDLASLRLAEAHAFHLTDVRLRLATTLDAAMALPPAPLVRPADHADVPALRALAEVSHTATRFFADPHFDRVACRALYATWIERSCAGWAEAVFVAEHAGAPAGYVTCHHRPDHGEIGLFAVAERAQGHGLGRALVTHALRWFHGRGLTRATVATQGRSVAAQRLYQGAGFRTDTVHLWHHRWFR